MDMESCELEWVSQHLGHNINTHKTFYRLHEGIVELTKVSRLLMAADDGNLSKYQGKKMKDISINGRVIHSID